MIRLPWVSREQHEEAVTLWRRIADAERENAQVLRHENAELLAKYHAVTSPKPVTLTVADGGVATIERAEPSEITKVIREQSETGSGQTDHALARHLRGYARQLKRDGKTDDQIVAALVQWQSTEIAEAS